MKPTVLIIDPHILFREGLNSLLNESGFNTSSFSPEDFLEQQKNILKDYSPDVIIMEFRLANKLGSELLKRIKSASPAPNVIILSISEETEDIIQALKLGAGAFVSKESTVSDVILAINTIIAKGFYVNEMVSGRLLVALREEHSPVVLSKKELEFLQWCSTDLTYAEIGERIGVSNRTIDNYRATLFSKLNINTRTGLVVYGIKNNLIEI